MFLNLFFLALAENQILSSHPSADLPHLAPMSPQSAEEDFRRALDAVDNLKRLLDAKLSSIQKDINKMQKSLGRPVTSADNQESLLETWKKLAVDYCHEILEPELRRLQKTLEKPDIELPPHPENKEMAIIDQVEKYKIKLEKIINAWSQEKHNLQKAAASLKKRIEELEKKLELKPDPLADQDLQNYIHALKERLSSLSEQYEKQLETERSQLHAQVLGDSPIYIDPIDLSADHGKKISHLETQIGVLKLMLQAQKLKEENSTYCC